MASSQRWADSALSVSQNGCSRRKEGLRSSTAVAGDIFEILVGFFLDPFAADVAVLVEQRIAVFVDPTPPIVDDFLLVSAHGPGGDEEAVVGVVERGHGLDQNRMLGAVSEGYGELSSGGHL